MSREEVYVTWRRAGILSYIAVSLHHENFVLPFFFTIESLMGSSLLEESTVHSKNLIPMNSQPSLGVESLHLPDTESIIGVEEGETSCSFFRPLICGD